MSAAKDTADIGPEPSITDAESDLEAGKDDEEGPTHDDETLGHTDTVAEEPEETSSSAARDGDSQPDQLASPPTRLAPAIHERPSSADGSLSIPDDTPSLKVCSYICSTTFTRY